jgi:hypothetical protein
MNYAGIALVLVMACVPLAAAWHERKLKNLKPIPPETESTQHATGNST